ncbi:Ldh family oxidoreductase [Pelagibius sp. 7325]|uniref:Ldh family oxidoreductase n=1 Tax=Pelagibius sp. 7325 TaxID=3131994 RepID=UPI0030ECBB83
MTASVTVSPAELRRLAVAALSAAGAQAQHAAWTADILVEGDMMGLGTHGVLRLLTYCERLRLGGIKGAADIAVERRAASLALVDGDNGLGPAVAMAALEAGLAMVADSGMAYLGCRESNHLGALAPYGLKACAAGYVLICGTNASTTIAPWGGREARLGNNPLSIAAPCPGSTESGGPHFLLDMAMSVAARGKIRKALDEGQPIPEGWAVDAAGKPTTDPAAALSGFLLPFGGHKGSGLSLAVDMLSGVLSGARFLTDISPWTDYPERPCGTGHFFLLIDPKRLLGAEAYDAAIAHFRDIVQTTPPADTAQPVQLPGQREQERRAAALSSGVAIPGDLLAQIEALAAA